MTQPDEWQAPYGPPREQNPPQRQPLPPLEPDPYPQTQPLPPSSGQGLPYQTPAPYQASPPYGPAASDQPGPPYGPGTPYEHPPYAAHGYPTEPRKNGLAIWSLVLGILSIVLFFSCLLGIFAAIPALVTGHLSRKAQRAGLADNGGMALAGIITGWVTVGLTVLVAGIFITLGLAGELD